MNHQAKLKQWISMLVRHGILFQDAKVGQHPVMVHPTKQREKVGSRMTEELLDINRESPSSVAAEKAIDSIDLSTSKTDSLDVEHLLHADQAGNSNSGSQQCLLPGLDPSCRWVKRLRLNLSDNHSHSTKNAEIGDCSRTAVMNKLYRKITDHRTSSGPTSSKVLDKGVGEMELEDTLLLLGKKESASMDPVKESRELNLSHPWIHRWCHSQTRDIKSVAPVACDMDSSRTAVDEYKTKQFPSIAAMALMGKTVNGLQACKFQNKGSFVVWKTGQF
ncbi:hypothetical protein IFM89_010749 [Coptis chinensis]|uniref:Uncharacterized protein n=1 Tax=Coptis chinensis TaxID=261450 RepID=A0A835IMU8_9MAGN|nr:hypothetical protein IFM89_010749 [Coptis chinensis]